MIDKHKTKVVNHGPWGFASLAAFIGAAVYFVQQSSGLWETMLAIFKALVWPAFVVYELLKLLNV